MTDVGPDDEACFYQFEAPSRAAVAETNRPAGVTFDRIVPRGRRLVRGQRRINDV